MRALLTLAFLALTPGMSLAFSAEALPQIVLKGGEGTPVPDRGVILLLTEITDQRCPPDVDCFWEGLIRAEITVLGPTQNLQAIVLCNLCEDGARSATVGGLTFTLVGLAPSTADIAKLGRAAFVTDYQLTVSYEPARP